MLQFHHTKAAACGRSLCSRGCLLWPAHFRYSSSSSWTSNLHVTLSLWIGIQRNAELEWISSNAAHFVSDMKAENHVFVLVLRVQYSLYRRIIEIDVDVQLRDFGRLFITLTGFSIADYALCMRF